MENSSHALNARKHSNYDVTFQPDAELLALKQLWERACAEVDTLELEGADARQISASIMRKVALEAAIQRAPCRSQEGAVVLLRTALEIVHTEYGDEIDEQWQLVEHAVTALGWAGEDNTVERVY